MTWSKSQSLDHLCLSQVMQYKVKFIDDIVYTAGHILTDRRFFLAVVTHIYVMQGYPRALKNWFSPLSQTGVEICAL